MISFLGVQRVSDIGTYSTSYPDSTAYSTYGNVGLDPQPESQNIDFIIKDSATGNIVGKCRPDPEYKTVNPKSAYGMDIPCKYTGDVIEVR